MFIVRDIFNLKYGHYQAVRPLMEEAKALKIFDSMKGMRVLTDFTGDAYRMILEASYNSLAEYESSMSSETGQGEWRAWFNRFVEHVNSGHREILRVMA